MNTVGADKRTQYYRRDPADVLKALKGHPLGLTNSEAARRHAEQGANVLPASTLTGASLALQAAGHPFVAMSALAAALASITNQTGMAAGLAGLTIGHLVLRFSFLRRHLSPDVSVALPSRVKVTRNDQTRDLETAKLVVGDIVHVTAGETVPADLRTLEEHDLVTNDSRLFGGNVQTRKFSHALSHAVPLIARNNQLWAGTTVVQGSARGVVTAIGAQTELGRIAVLRQAAVANKLAREDRNPARYMFAGWAIFGAVALLLLGWQSGTSSTGTLLALLLFAVSTVPNGLGLSRRLLSALASRQLPSAMSDATLAKLGRVDLAIIDTSDATRNTVVAAAVTVGRTTYTAENTGYEPTGKINDERGKALTRKQTADLKLLFEACALVNSAAVLRPGVHQAWHARGNLYEVAALVLARKAGLNTEQLQTKHELQRAFPYDAGRRLASSVRRYGNDAVVFVRGNPEAVLERSRKLWDHGHVRPLSAGDKAFLARQTPDTKGKAYTAFAYRILPDKTDLQALDMDSAEQDLTFLGVVTMEHASTMDSMVTAAQSAGLHTATLAADTHAGSISSAALRKLTDTQLLALLRAGASFSRLAAEDVLRLVTVAQHAGHNVALIGHSLTDLPARIQADAGLVLAASHHPEVNSLHDAAELTTVISTGRRLLAKLTLARRLAVMQSIALAAATLLGAIGLFYSHMPLAVTLAMVLVLQLLVLPMAALALPQAKGYQVATRELVAASSALGMLAYATFLYVFNASGVSPVFISSTSRFTIEAGTAAAMVLGLSLLIEVLLVHYQSKTALSTRSVAWLAIAAIVIVSLVYSPWVQSLLGSTRLTPTDWLGVCVTVLCYAGFRLFQHHTRHHTREAVLRLHHETFGRQ